MNRQVLRAIPGARYKSKTDNWQQTVSGFYYLHWWDSHNRGYFFFNLPRSIVLSIESVCKYRSDITINRDLTGYDSFCQV